MNLRGGELYTVQCATTYILYSCFHFMNFTCNNRCNGLRKLKLIACPKLSDIGLLEVSKGRIGLQEIVLAHCPLLTDKSVESLLSNCRSLSCLHLIVCFIIIFVFYIVREPFIYIWSRIFHN